MLFFPKFVLSSQINKKIKKSLTFSPSGSIIKEEIRQIAEKSECSVKVKYNVEKLKEIIYELSTVTGLSLGFADTEYKLLCKRTKESDIICISEQSTEEGKRLCSMDDYALLQICHQRREAVSHICHAGLMDMAVPIFKGGFIVGYVIIGRVVAESNPSEIRREGIMIVSHETIESMKNLISHIVFESAIEIEYDSLASRVREYVRSNISSPITVASLSSELLISKNKLYKLFSGAFDSTVNDYVNNERIKLARELLESGSESVSSVAQATGFSSDAYFSRIFKRMVGVSPSTYRRTHKPEGAGAK